MATDLETRKSSSKTEAFLQRKFADVATRIQRVDLVTHLLALALTLLGYALAVGVFDWLVGNSTAAYVSVFRWAAGLTFLVVSFSLIVLAVRCLFRRINPYYVAHQLEQTLPDAKNGLINWLDLHDDDLPAVFQKNLRNRAAEQWEEGDADVIVTKRKNWILLGTLGIPLVGLTMLLILDPSGLFASMRRAFVPINAPPPLARTHLTLLAPEGGDVEIIATQAVKFAVRLEGRVPTGNRPDAAKLHWRYQQDDDFFTLPLDNEGGGLWTASLQPEQLRTGITYKISAGDAETPEHQVRVRARAHVTKYEITYRHRAYRKLPKMPSSVFPNEESARPHVVGPRGSDVEMVVRTSRPIKSVQVELVVGKLKKDLPIELSKSDPKAFVCRFPLEQSGQFRVLYTAADGEENVDREWCDFVVQDDELPRVILTRPGKDSEIPCNSSFILEGKATSVFGVRGLALQFRVIAGADAGKVTLLPLAYRQGKSFKLENGTYPLEIEYMEYVKLDELLDDKGAKRTFAAGAVLEYWLEASDGADYPKETGNVGRSITCKIKLLDAVKDEKKEQERRKQLTNQKNQHQKQQDDKFAKDGKKQPDKKDGGKGSGSEGGENSEQSANQTKKEIDDANSKLKSAMQEPQPERGAGKGADPKNSESKSGQGSADAPEPQQKGQPMMPPEDAGQNKTQEGGESGQPKDNGLKEKKPDGPSQGNAKGAEQNGPEQPSQAQQNAKNAEPPPNAQAKGGTSNEPGTAKSEPKDGPPEAAKGPGETRKEEPKLNPKEPSWDEIAKKIEDLSEPGAKGHDAAKDLKDIAAKADDPRKAEIAKEALAKNGRDPKTGKNNPFGSGGQSSGIRDDIKIAAVNRAFAAKIGQMQLDDWQKRITPDLLKKAGMSEADWQRYLKNMQTYDAQVRALNAQITRKALKELSGPRNTPAAKLNSVESTGTSNVGAASNALPPPELRDAQKRFTAPPPGR